MAVISQEPGARTSELGAQPAPGWYPDPAGHLPYRWWDGAAWSAYAADSQVQWDPLPVEVVKESQPGLPGTVLAIVAFVFAIGLSLLSILVLHLSGRPGGLSVELVVSEIFLWAPLVTAAVFISKRRGTGSLAADYGLRIRLVDVGFGFVASIAARSVAAVVVLPVVVFHPVFRSAEHSQLSQFTGNAWDWVALGVVTCVGAPVVEELFFRGVLQTRFVRLLGPVSGIVLASVLFGTAHLLDWAGPVTFVYALSVAGGGLVLGTVRHLTGRLGTSMVTHAFFNAQALVALAVTVHWAHQI